MSSVNVLCPNGRRQNVKVNPNTRVLQIIETVCAKQGFDPAEYNLKHHRAIVDVQLPFRYANLPNNATLELVKAGVARKASPAQVALQLVSGERLQHSFAPSASLWDVLSHWEEQPDSVHKGELMATKTDNDGQLLYPVCIYMRQEIIGEAALKSASLHTLGLAGGRALIRLIHRATDLPASEPDPPPPVKKTQTKSASDPSQTKVESSNKSVSHGSMDNSTAVNRGDNKSIQQGRDDNQMEVDSSSNKLTSTNSRQSVAGSDSPMDVDISSSSEGVSSVVERASTSRDTGARPRNQEPEIILNAEQEKRANDMGAAMAEAIMQQRASTLASQIVPQLSPFANFKFPDAVGSKSSSKQSDKQQSIKPCERLPLVYNTRVELPVDLQTGGDLPENFFDLTVSDVRRMYSDLRNQNTKMDVQHLETKSMREARERRDMQRYPKVVVRIHFPDNLSLQGFFRPQETVEAVSEFVKSHLEDSSDKFYLYTTPPKMVLKDAKQTLYAAKLCPAAVVHFGSSTQKGHHLSESATSQVETLIKADELVAKNLETPHHSAGTSRVPVSSSDMAGPSTSAGASASGGLNVPANSEPSVRRQQSASAAAPSGKVPKWFKVGKK